MHALWPYAPNLVTLTHSNLISGVLAACHIVRGQNRTIYASDKIYPVL